MSGETLRIAFLAMLVFNIASIADAQDLRFKILGETPGEAFGFSVDGGGDCNADGVPDLIAGAPLHLSSGQFFGRVRVLSGVDGAVLQTFDADFANNGLGFLVRFAGDADLDGHDDLLLGYADEFKNGVARVFSGADGSLILEWTGAAQSDGFGWSADVAGDVDGDGRDDFIIGSPFADPGGSGTGSVSIYSGADGLFLRKHDGSFPSGFFGHGVGGGGNFDGDAYGDYMIMEPYSGGGGAESGTLYVYSGGTGSLLWSVTGQAGDKLGNSADVCADVNGDGLSEVLVGIPFRDQPNGKTDAGAACLYSGVNGDLIYEFPGGFKSGQLGFAVRCAGDVNRDGAPDLLVGSAFEDSGAGQDGGRARLFSGATGSLLYRFDMGHNPNSQFGWDLCGTGDTDMDGIGDLLISAKGESTAADAGVGAIYLLRGNDLWFDVTPREPFPDATLTFATRGLDVGDPVIVFLMQVDGSPFVGGLFFGLADLDGAMTVDVTVPAGLTGHEFSFQSFAMALRGGRPQIVDSFLVDVNFQ